MNEKIAQALVDANVMKFGKFVLASGRESPVYVDIRVVPSYPKSFQTVVDEMSKIIDKLGVDVIAGAETAGIPLSAAIALKLKKPMVYVRKRPKGYGTDSKIEGVISKGQKAILIDDMMTNGGSKIRFIDGIRAAEADVEDIAIVLDREQGGAEMLSENGVKVHSLITLRQMLDYMNKNELIDDETVNKVLIYLKQNKE
jgi:orotate phosphoribosyltransferase